MVSMTDPIDNLYDEVICNVMDSYISDLSDLYSLMADAVNDDAEDFLMSIDSVRVLLPLIKAFIGTRG